MPSAEHTALGCLIGVTRPITIICSCGFDATSDTWEKAGAEMDSHLREAQHEPDEPALDR